jgi:YesN/AraC family two-component response regulator
MKKKLWLILGAAALILISCATLFFLQSEAAGKKTDDRVILKTKESTFTEREIRTRMEMYCRKYSFTIEKLYDEPEFWNQMVKDIVYEYAGAEIAREISEQNGLENLNDDELKQVQEHYDAFLSDIEKIGEDQNSYLKRLGFSEETLWTFSENQVYSAKLMDYWAQELDVSNEPSMASYEKLLNYTKRMWDEINNRVDRGEYAIDESSLLQKVSKKGGL